MSTLTKIAPTETGMFLCKVLGSPICTSDEFLAAMCGVIPPTASIFPDEYRCDLLSSSFEWDVAVGGRSTKVELHHFLATTYVHYHAVLRIPLKTRSLQGKGNLKGTCHVLLQNTWYLQVKKSRFAYHYCGGNKKAAIYKLLPRAVSVD